jgi:hypothetical protein
MMALAGALAIGGSAAETRQAWAGDGFARYLMQQAREREQERLRDQARLRNQRRRREQSKRVIVAAPPTANRFRPGSAAGNILSVARPRTASAAAVPWIARASEAAELASPGGRCDC